jgi:hypothetical protein
MVEPVLNIGESELAASDTFKNGRVRAVFSLRIGKPARQFLSDDLKQALFFAV